MNLREKIMYYIKEFNELSKKYRELNEKTKQRYDWRERAIDENINLLENLLEENNFIEIQEWKKAYQEDLEEYHRSLNKRSLI